MTFYFLGWKARYEKLMIDNLANDHDVRMLSVPGYAKKVLSLCKSIRKRASLVVPLEWLARRVNAGNGAMRSDVLVCNETQAIRGLNPQLVATFPGVRILLVRDLVDAAFVERMRPHFNCIYSYDPVQCQQLGMEFLDQFFPFNVESARQSSRSERRCKPLCFFLGRDKGRAARLDRLAQTLRAEGCEVDFNIVKDDTSQLLTHFHTDSVVTYEDNLSKAQNSDVLVELNQPGQTGLTLRPLEAAFFDKKLITDNKWVKEMEFYHPDRFYVLGDEQRDLGQFLRAQAPQVDPRTLRKHSPEGLMDRLLAASA